MNFTTGDIRGFLPEAWLHLHFMEDNRVLFKAHGSPKPLTGHLDRGFSESSSLIEGGYYYYLLSLAFLHLVGKVLERRFSWKKHHFHLTWNKIQLRKRKRNYLYVFCNLELLLKQTTDLKTLLQFSVFSPAFSPNERRNPQKYSLF